MARHAYTDEEIAAAVAESTTLTEVLRRLGLRAAGGNFGSMRGHIARLALSTDHLDPNTARRAASSTKGRPFAEVLVQGSSYSRTTLKRRLYAAGIKHRACEQCGQGEEWQGRHMSLILDHINGVHDDNRLENLQILCPNCASTLDTHCARNLRRPITPMPCRRCGTMFAPNRPGQQYCSSACGTRWNRDRLRRPRPETRRVERPPHDVLLAEIAATSWLAVGRKYGVSDNAVRKWVRAYENAQAAPGAVSGFGSRQEVIEQGALGFDATAASPNQNHPASDQHDPRSRRRGEHR